MFGLDKFGGIGLHRIQRFFESEGIDLAQLSKRSLVITGTNGKGSTAHLAAAALGAHGLKVGLFTSPHMFDLRERFLLGGDQIDPETFDRLSARVLAFNDTLPADDQLGAFQFLFLVAVLWFEETGPDAIVWEAGIGGRYDPVRMVRAHIGAVTSVELEHTEVLGGTEELIAYDKVDAVTPGGTVLLSPLVPTNLRTRLETYSSLSNRKLAGIPDGRTINDITHSIDGTSFRLSAPDEPDQTIQLSMIGEHQAYNAVTADRLAHGWLSASAHSYDAEASWRAISAVRIPGRLERIDRSPDVWIDVGHTPHAVAGVIRSFQGVCSRSDVIVVFGVSSTKEVAAISKLVASSFDEFILTQAHRSGAGPEQFVEAFPDNDGARTIEPDISAAAQQARARAVESGKCVLVVGGLFLAAEFQVAWAGGDPRTLDFL